VAERLAERLERGLPDAEGRIWHGHPVWMDGANPVAGYKAFPKWVTVLFWKGQLFTGSAGLTPSGSGQLASVKVTALAELDTLPLDDWVARAAELGG
jgi:hypothetical protein